MAGWRLKDPPLSRNQDSIPYSKSGIIAFTLGSKQSFLYSVKHQGYWLILNTNEMIRENPNSFQKASRTILPREMQFLVLSVPQLFNINH